MDPYEQRREERRRERERARLEEEERLRKEEEERKKRREARRQQLLNMGNLSATLPSTGTQDLLQSITPDPVSTTASSGRSTTSAAASTTSGGDSILGKTTDDGQKATKEVGETKAGETLEEMRERIRRERARERREELKRAEEEAERIRQQREEKRKQRLRRDMEQANETLQSMTLSKGNVVLSEEQLKLLMEMKDELSTIKNDIDVANKDKADALILADGYKRRIAELEEALAVYRTVPKHKTGAPQTPEAASRLAPIAAAPVAAFGEIGVGEECLVQFSREEYCVRRVKEVTPGSEDVVVVSEDGEENVVTRAKVFPPLPALLERLGAIAGTEAAVRARHDAMERAYQAQIDGLKGELAERAGELEKLKKFYSVDLRKLQRRDKFGVSDVMRSYGMECDVVCYAAEHVDTVDEYSKNDNRWYTANRGADELWAPLSDRVDELTQPPKRLMGRRARLFQLYRDGDVGSLEVFQARALCQRDMSSSRVCIVDTFAEIFVYVGCNAPHQDEVEATNAALGMAKVFKDGRARDTPVVVVYEGKEPLRFKAHFANWTPRKSREELEIEKAEKALEEKEKSEGITRRMAEAGETDSEGKAVPKVKAVPPEDEDDDGCREYYSYEQLKKPEALPVGVDRTCLHEYLTEDDFEKVFGMRRSDFVALPEWRQIELRVVHHLY